MTHPIDPERFRFVVAVDTDGQMQLHSTMCDSAAADMLHRIASWLQSGNGPRPCLPDFEQGDDNLTEVPVNSRAGKLDAARKRWTDGAGHVWNLALDWEDYTDRTWRWTGRVDQGGRAPVMRAMDDSGETEPLDVLRALYGPLFPKVGERR